jgi:hypothetical protein
MLNYYLAITIGPILIFGINFFIREKLAPLFKRIIFRGIDSFIHLVFYSYFLGELGLASKFDTGWAFWSVLYFSTLGLIIFVPIGIYLRWFKKTK